MTYAGPYAPLQGEQVSAAFNSVLHLSFEVRAGLLMRQIHHWAALVFVAAIVVHMMRVFFTGAFRRPRELNWLVGIGLVLLALAEGITGYSLPDDLLSARGCGSSTRAILSIPFIGPVAGVPHLRRRVPDPRRSSAACSCSTSCCCRLCSSAARRRSTSADRLASRSTPSTAAAGRDRGERGRARVLAGPGLPVGPACSS